LKLKVIAAGSIAALVLVPVAAAKSHHGHHHRQSVAQLKTHVRASATGHGSVVSAAVAYLQLDRATIAADLRAGQSLAQIATAQGKTADGLVTALLAPAKLKLDAAVAAGRLTSDKETAFLAKLQTAVTAIVNHASAPRVTHTRPVRVTTAAILKPALTYLQLDLRGLIAQLRSGKTLADVAVAQGKTAAGLVDAVVASVKAQLDARVTAGKLTTAQETTFLTTLQTNVAKLVNG
jgi:hypothetical protein